MNGWAPGIREAVTLSRTAWRSMTPQQQWDYADRLMNQEGGIIATPIDGDMLTAASYPDSSLCDAYVPGSTEPWISELVCALLKASGRTRVLELGGFMGVTSAWLALTLEHMGGGSLTVAEWDPEAPERADWTQARLDALTVPKVEWKVVRSDALTVIRSFADESLDFVFCDDDHQKAHVTEEIQTLLPKMTQGGLIVGHDVYGSCDLQEVFTKFGGYSLDLPRLGTAGGLGMIQIR